MSNSNLILQAVVSRLISERDDALVQLDFIVNKGKINSDVKDIVSDTTDIIKQLSNIEQAIETINNIINQNNEIAKQAELINAAMQDLNNKETTNENDIPS